MAATPQPACGASTARELIAAIASGAPLVCVHGRISGLPALTLAPGQALAGASVDAMLVFERDGLGLTRGNSIRAIDLVSPSECRVIYLDGAGGDRGLLDLCDITCNGQLSFIFGDETAAASLNLENIAVAGADTRPHPETPRNTGERLLQGAITIWNRATHQTIITLRATRLDIGFADMPVKGSGVFIAGAGSGIGGVVIARDVEVNAVHIDTGVMNDSATAAGGVFILADTSIDRLICTGSVVTHGANAIAIENCGRVGDWFIDGNAICHGPDAVSFLNAGQIGRLEVTGSIETFGNGGKACGIYGPVKSLRAGAIRTHGDAAVGVQITGPLTRLEVRDGIVTTGEPGYEFSRAGLRESPAHAIHISADGSLGCLVAGHIMASGSKALQLFNEGTFGSTL